MSQQTLHVALWIPPAVVMTGIVAALIADAAERRKVSLWLVALGLALGAVACLIAAGEPSAGAAEVLSSSAGLARLAGVGYALAACAVIAGIDRLAELDRGAATGALIGIGAVFSHALLVCMDMKVLLVVLAGSAIVGYALVAGAGSRRAEEAAVRYFIQGAVAAGLTVYGLAVTFALAGGTSGYADAGGVIGDAAGRPGFLALGLVSAVFAFKLGAFPFHAWVPDAYETANASDVAFLGAVPKMATLVALFVVVERTLFASSGYAASKGLFAALALGSLLFGAFGMVRQRSVPRLLGYSAIAQVGYGLAAIASGAGAASATVVFSLTYAVGVSAAFVALEAVRRLRPEWDGSLGGLEGLSRRSPLVAGSLAVSMLSLTGVPLFAGFWGKLLVFTALVDADMIWLAVAAGLVAVVSFAGYGSVIKWSYFQGAAGEGDAGQTGEATPAGADRGTGRAVASVLALAVLILGVAPLIFGIGKLVSLFAPI